MVSLIMIILVTFCRDFKTNAMSRYI